MHELGWDAAAWPLLGCGTVAGHLLECAGQVTGGYFADPGAQGRRRPGAPRLSDCRDRGGRARRDHESAGLGGRVTVATCTEQLLYEIHDPAAYTTPDVVADFSGVRMRRGRDRDRVRMRRRSRSRADDTLKVSLGYWTGSSARDRSLTPGRARPARAELARSDRRGAPAAASASRGRDALRPHRHRRPAPGTTRSSRVARARTRCGCGSSARTKTLADAVRVGNEVEALYTNGPAAGAGVTKSATRGPGGGLDVHSARPRVVPDLVEVV